MPHGDRGGRSASDEEESDAPALLEGSGTSVRASRHTPGGGRAQGSISEVGLSFVYGASGWSLR